MIVILDQQFQLILQRIVVNKIKDFIMRNIDFIFVLIACFAIIEKSISCDFSNDTISRQGQVDSFNIYYPGCTKIAGNMVITGAITNLDSLYRIRQIAGTLSIINTQLKNCLGLYNLDTIYGFRCIYNAVLKNLYGLESLTYAGAIYIKNNVALEEIHSISSTDFTDFFLCECPKILVILGFNTPILLSNIVIENNDGIIAIDAFNKVEELTGNYKIALCSSLSTLSTGYKLKFLHGSLHITALRKLVVFPSFENLILVKKHLTIQGLTTLTQWKAFNNLQSTFDLRIYFARELEFYPDFPKLTLVKGDLDLGDNFKIRYMDGFNALDSVQGSLRIFRSDSLISVNGFKNLRFIGSQFSVGNLRSLKEINGFGQLNYVEYTVHFHSLWLVTELNIFSNLNHIKKLYIWTNKYLNNISWLNNLNINKLEELQIISNDSLSYCHYEAICKYLNENKGKHDIRFNKKGCNNAEEILEACRTVGVDDLKEKDLTIYPNPTSSHFYIESDAELEADDIEIFTTTGSKVPFIRVGDAVYPHALEGGIMIVKIKYRDKPW
mgnify:CR=1 FL=1